MTFNAAAPTTYGGRAWYQNLVGNVFGAGGFVPTLLTSLPPFATPTPIPVTNPGAAFSGGTLPGLNSSLIETLYHFGNGTGATAAGSVGSGTPGGSSTGGPSTPSGSATGAHGTSAGQGGSGVTSVPGGTVGGGTGPGASTAVLGGLGDALAGVDWHRLVVVLALLGAGYYVIGHRHKLGRIVKGRA